MHTGSPSPASTSAIGSDTYPAAVSTTQRSPRMQRPAMRYRTHPYAMPGNFYNAHDFVIRDSVVANVTYTSETFMKEFEKHTIPGAEFDSSDRDPPPQCHPGTRLSIVERAQSFSAGHRGDKRLLWLVGPAGVGKSAIMQTLAENASTPTSNVALGASLFFSINERRDASKAIPTLAYQIAVNHHAYRQFIHNRMIDDPKLPSKSIRTQFRTFFIEPFVEHAIYHGPKPLLIIIDGLDECADQDKQCELVSLISYFSLAYPDVLLTWIIASRPEPHLTYTFSRPSVASNFVKEEILIDSDEARADVERYLRDKLENIRAKSPAFTSSARWPAERDFLKLSVAADGLFAYAIAAIRFIDDPAYGNPVSQLELLLEIIDNTLATPGKNQSHPMANLHALYSRILSRVPPNVLKDTKKLLLWTMTSDELDIDTMARSCDWLAITPFVAYSALHHLHSVLDIPARDAAERDLIKFFHKSFRDYLCNFEQSQLFEDVQRESDELNSQCAIRILKEVLEGLPNPKGTDVDPSTHISLSWTYQSTSETDVQHMLHGDATGIIFSGPLKMKQEPQCPGIIPMLVAIDVKLCLDCYWENFDCDLCDFLFDDCRVAQLKECNVLQDMPLGMINKDNIDVESKMEITFQTQDTGLLFNYKNLCKCWDCVSHCSPKVDKKPYTFTNWVSYPCIWQKQVSQDLEYGKIHSPEHLVTAFSDAHHFGWVCYEFVGQEDKSSQWKYIIPYRFC